MSAGRPPDRAVAPDLVRAPELAQMRGSVLGRPMTLLASTTSTSDEAKHAAKGGAPHGATWVAEAQTAGRGRQGRTWIAPPGESLLFSVLLREGRALEPARLPHLALVAGLAVRDAVARAAPRARPMIKWPNDVLVSGAKIAGVLVEAVTQGSRVQAVVVGIGVNVHTRVFPAELAGRATSLALVRGGSAGGSAGVGVGDPPPDRGELLADILATLDHDMTAVAARGLGLVRARIEAVDALRGRRVRSDRGDEGIADGIDDEGRLRVRADGGEVMAWLAGEVHLVGDR